MDGVTCDDVLEFVFLCMQCFKLVNMYKYLVDEASCKLAEDVVVWVRLLVGAVDSQDRATEPVNEDALATALLPVEHDCHVGLLQGFWIMLAIQSVT